MRLSVLDLSPVGEGSSPAEALRSSLDLARRVERLGYHRYWVAEHHNMPGIASSSPPVLLAHAASVTSSIRIGSGGVMLPNHSALVVAEQFGTLEALHPGRVDLGIGRAPGTDQVTARALRRAAASSAVDDFPEQLTELLGYFSGSMPEGHPYAGITATPGVGYRPTIWLLGSSDYSAHAAGVLGMPFSFAHHFAGHNTNAAIDVYRRAFRPSALLEQPYVMLGTSVICAESEERAEWLAGPGRLSMARLRSGRPGRLPTPEHAAAHEWSPFEREIVRSSTAVVGTPDDVRARLDALVARTGADELMITTMVHGHEDRIRSYELLAEVMGQEAVAITSGAQASGAGSGSRA